MLETAEERLKSCFSKIKGRMNDSCHEFAFDYISHGENRLALETLLDYIYEYDVDISQSEFDEMMDLVEFYQADMSKLMYLQGLVKKVQ